MYQLQLTLSPEQAHTPELLKQAAAKALGIETDRVSSVRLTRKSIDSRGGFPKINLAADIFTDGEQQVPDTVPLQYETVDGKPEVIVVGAGPAGLFASLRLIELGLKPVLVERGQPVGDRKRDIAAMIRGNAVNPESNYCFGEGGAGTFSDGKLYTRSTKKGDVRRILSIFHYHGAQDEILFETHPHIGTDRLPQIIKSMRETILGCGGDVYFGAKVTALETAGGKVTGVRLQDGRFIQGKAVILATGHSARDVYSFMHESGILLEAKGFAMGVRVEHPQSLIDSIQYHRKERGDFLPAASYNLVEQIEGRGVYSFCMCPGGHIVPAATSTGEVVVNGMSASHRNSPFANSGLVVEIRPDDLGEYARHGVLAGLYFQQYLEELAFFNNGGKGLVSPAQRVADFVKGKLSGSLPECSYLPGTISSPLHFWLPEHISSRLRQGFRQFDRKMKGYLTNEAQILSVESRSSSPVRIPRDRETLQHIQIGGLFPCGEGAGYAGGITSSAIDGENCAVAAKRFLDRHLE
jgi:uncharacterized FAD-dependent dehydrogenase